MQYNFTIIHPSRNRPEQAEKTIKLWLGNAKDQSKIQYILSVDHNDKYLSRYRSISEMYCVKLHIAVNKSAIQAINRAAKKSEGNIIIVVSDDFISEKDWDEKLIKELEGKEDFIVKTQDGIQDWIITLPLMDRKYYDRFGYVYFPGYQHLFCDTEMTAVADLTGRKITSQLFFEHQHYSTGKSKKDAINAKNDATWNQGKKLYNQRKSINFGL